MTTTGAEPGLPDLDLSRAVWKKNNYSGGNGSCVEVADLGEQLAVRDSKDKAGPKLVFARAAWLAFLEDVRVANSLAAPRARA